MRRSLVLVLAFSAAACQSQIPHGTGPITIQPNVQLSWQRYLDHRDPIVFLVSVDGAISYSTYCKHLQCEPDPLYVIAEKRCAELAGKPCKVFAEGRTIVWQGPVAYASLGSEPVAGATVDWGETGTLYGLKIGGFSAGTGTFSGRIRERACVGSIDVRSASWRLECGSDLKARGSLSGAGAGRWGGFGWSDRDLPVRLFVALDIALGRGTGAGARASPDASPPAAFPSPQPTFEEPAPPLIPRDMVINRG